MTGSDVDIIKIIAKRLGFSFTLQTARGWGAPVHKDSLDHWTGIIGKVQNETAHIGIGHITYQYERERVIDYVLSYYMTTHFITTKPEQLSSFWNILYPFNGVLWMTFIITLIAACSTFGIISKYVYNEEIMGNALKLYQLQCRAGNTIFTFRFSKSNIQFVTNFF